MAGERKSRANKDFRKQEFQKKCGKLRFVKKEHITILKIQKKNY